MTWTCDQTEARLSDYLEGLLSATQRAEFEAHLSGCAECAPLVAGVRDVLSEMQAVEPVEVPPGLIYRILDQTLGPREHVTFWQGFKNFIAGLATPKFAYGSASVMATLFILLSASGVSWRKPKLADLNPSTMSRNIVRQVHLKMGSAATYVNNLWVVYEIQSRLRQDENQLSVPQDGAPRPKSENEQEKKDDNTRNQPKQQNRADDLLARQMEMLAAQYPAMIERSYR